MHIGHAVHAQACAALDLLLSQLWVVELHLLIHQVPYVLLSQLRLLKVKLKGRCSITQQITGQGKTEVNDMCTYMLVGSNLHSPCSCTALQASLLLLAGGDAANPSKHCSAHVLCSAYWHYTSYTTCFAQLGE